jgi:hypothetical protein
MADDLGLARAVLVLVAGDRELPLGTVGPTASDDLEVIDRLARFQLAVNRQGLTLRVAWIDGDLRSLVELLGLTACFGLDPPMTPIGPRARAQASMRGGSPNAAKSSG